MENLKEFVVKQIENLPFNRANVELEVDLDLDIEKIINRLKQVEVYRLTQKEIDDQLEDYPDYYENLNEGDIVYSDGEVAYVMEAIQFRIWEIQSQWRNGEFYEGNEIEYIERLYTRELAARLEQEKKSST